MHVNSMKNLETICNAIEGSRTKSSSYGLLTQSLRMDGYCTIPHWQQHAFFRSIPNLRHLDLGRTRYQEMNTHMIRLNNPWKSLESLRVEVHGSKRAVDTKSFVERQLFFFPIQMYSNIWKHSSFLLQPCHNGPILFSGNFFVHYKFLSNSLEMVMKRFMQCFLETLSSLSVKGRVGFSMSVFVKLDNMLGSCVALTQLKIRVGQLWINLDRIYQGREQHEQQYHQQRQEQKHGFRALELQSVVASADVFHYIYFRCRRLKYKSLDGCSISGSISEKTGCLLVDMSYTFFKYYNSKKCNFTHSNIFKV
ncbi:hypothetical protein J3Q64DRAFT_1826682 [Phycomyces blakesleeanus]|uniref:Uncharacterized protein n=1 Tax=Phycomyces blakesleeanus TaxID=4837 RepID=A0ABR3AHL7_PHYBL